MGILSMFDKLDDIVYEPVKAISGWITEPLKKFEHKREMASEKNAAEIAAYSARQAAELEVDQRKWNEEIDELIADAQMRRDKEMVEAIKQYQLDLSSATIDIVNSLGVMSMELRRQANNLLEEKTRSYKAIQDEAKQQSVEELQNAKEMFFEDDPETYKMMVSTILSERKSMVEVAQRFMLELSEDFKRLNQNTDALLQMGMANVDKYLDPIAKQLGSTTSLQNEFNNKQIEDKNIINV